MEDPALGKGLLCVGVFALVPVLKEWMGRSSQWKAGKNSDWENGQGVRGVGWWNWRSRDREAVFGGQEGTWGRETVGGAG